jgi:putative transposase
VIILRRQVKRPACTRTDRILLVFLARMVRTWKQALFIVQPETLLRWHRQSFKLLWKYKSRAMSTTPKISAETIALIKEMARDNRLWGAERIRGELLKLGIRVCKRTIQKYITTTAEVHKFFQRCRCDGLRQAQHERNVLHACGCVENQQAVVCRLS